MQEKIKHIDIKHLVIQDLMREGVIGAVEKVLTDDHIPDIGTKAHTHDRMVYLLSLMGTTLVPRPRDDHLLDRSSRKAVAAVSAHGAPTACSCCLALLSALSRVTQAAQTSSSSRRATRSWGRLSIFLSLLATCAGAPRFSGKFDQPTAETPKGRA